MSPDAPHRSPPGVARARRALLAAALAVPFVWWSWLAFGSPAGRLLRPGAAAWIVPAELNLPDPRDGSPARARYRVRFDVGPRPPARAVVEIDAWGDFRLAAGGVPRFWSATLDADRRRPVRLDLAPWLGPGVNELAVEVSDPRGPGPLRVVAGPGAPAAVATGSGAWRTAAEGGWRPAADAGDVDRRLPGGRFRWRRPLSRLAYPGLIAVVLGLAATGLARGRRRVRPPPAAGDVPARRPGRSRGRWAVAAALAVAVGAHLWNGWDWRVQRSGMDYAGHLQYVRHAAATWRVPLAEEGWQMYHPPLYYWTAGAVYRLAGGEEDEQPGLRWLARFGGAVGAAHVLLAALLLGRFGPRSALARAVALLAVGLAPMSLVTHGMITNEPTAALVAGAAAVAGALVLARRAPPGPLAGALLGALCGLALLAKFTGLMPTAAVGLGLALRALDRPARRRVVPAIAAFAVAVAAIAGPFYLRNLRVYGDPFAGNWEPATGHAYEQRPGYRTLGFFLRFGDVFTHEPRQARGLSFWDGLYGSAWGERLGGLVPFGERRTAAATLALYALALLPTAAGLAGFAAGVARAAGGGREAAGETVLVAVALFSVVAVAAFTLRLPYHSTVKAFFLLHLIAPATLFVARGLALVERGLGRARWLLLAPALAQAALALALFLRR